MPDVPVVFVGQTPGGRFHGVRERATSWEGGIKNVRTIPLSEALSQGMQPCNHKMCIEELTSLARRLSADGGTD